VLFVPALFADLGIKLFSFISPLTYPLSLAGIVSGVWYALGVVLVIYFALRHPRRIGRRPRRRGAVNLTACRRPERPSAWP
jgi:hypothetical protein